MELNFVFLRVGAVRRYCPRAKNEKRQNRLGFDVQAYFNVARSLPFDPMPKTTITTSNNLLIFFGVVQATLSTASSSLKQREDGIIYLILEVNLLLCNKRIFNKGIAVKIFSVHIHSRNLMIVIGGVVINALICIAAACVNC